MTYLFTGSSGVTDAFGRTLVTTPFTLGDYKHVYGLDPNFIDYVPNGGNVTFRANEAAARLTTNNNPTCRVVHQSKFYHHYMPGKSQTILSSFNFYNYTANVVKRTGYFDDNNGIYLEQDSDGVLYFVLRSYVTGAPLERKIPQSQWNGDRCDGTGESKFSIDITKTQLLYVDFQWLGVGRVRCGFVHQDEYVYAHTFYNSNNLANVYMSTPNLPVRCEIKNVGVTNGAYFDQICSTVVSEGGYVEAGQDWAASTPSLISVASGITKPIIAIRLTNLFRQYDNRMIVRIGNLKVFSDGDSIKWRLVKLPGNTFINANTLAWTNVNTNSGVEFNSDITAFTDGEEIDNGFVGASTQGSQKAAGSPPSNLPSEAKKNYIVQNFNSTNSEIFLVEAKNLGSQATNVGIGIQWREIY
jgi:hypothetical protein